MEQAAVQTAVSMCLACGRPVPTLVTAETPVVAGAASGDSSSVAVIDPAAPAPPDSAPPGLPALPAHCTACGALLGIAPPDRITNSTVSVGFVGSGRGSKAGIAVIDANNVATLFTEDGVVRRITSRQLRHFSDMRGLTSMTSRLGAALVTLEHLPIPSLAGSVAARTALHATLVGVDPLVARRAASDLAAAGVAAPIERLPLSTSEIHWWSALAELRVQQFDAAVSHLAELPLGAYAPAVGLLVLCTGAPIAAVSRRARTVLEGRLLAVDASSPLSGAATVAGRRTPLIDWLVHPTPFEAVADLPVDFPSASVVVLRALAGRGDRDEPVVLPASAKPGVIDDLIDRDFRIAAESLKRLDRERVMYIAARLHPESLTDEEVEELDFEEEHDRRLLHAGRIGDPTPDRPDTPLIGAIRELVANHRSSQPLRDKAGPMGDALAAFLAAPTNDGLIDAIADDESLWVLLERTLPDEALEWDPPEGGSARRFLTWWASRLTQRRLHAGDFHGALEAARHAVRLSSPGSARLEAQNMMACTFWLLGKDQSARDCLLEAMGMGRDDVLEANLAIVNSGDGGTGRRHPHVILGLPTGAERATAERAFATRSRMARRDPEFPFSTEDLIWALDQIETAIDEPARATAVFRMPIDSRVLQVPIGHGLLRPAPQPLARRTAATSDGEIHALIAEARSDALLHVLKGAGAEARRSLGAGRDTPPPRPAPLSEYPRQRTSRLPQYIVGTLVVAGGVTASLIVLNNKSDEDVEATADTSTTVTAAPIATLAPTTVPATTTTDVAEVPGVGDAIVVGGSSITPHDPVDAYGHLCLVFDITGDGPLGFVPSALTVVYGARTARPNLDIVTGRGTSDVVFGETGSVVREVCFPARGWRDNTTDLLYDTDSGEVRWRIWEPAG